MIRRYSNGFILYCVKEKKKYNKVKQKIHLPPIQKCVCQLLKEDATFVERKRWESCRTRFKISFCTALI